MHATIPDRFSPITFRIELPSRCLVARLAGLRHQFLCDFAVAVMCALQDPQCGSWILRASTRSSGPADASFRISSVAFPMLPVDAGVDSKVFELRASAKSS